MEIALNRLGLGVLAEVSQVGGNERLKNRLAEMGLVPGTKVCCRYRSPGGFVTALEFGGTVLALRTRDLKHIKVWC